MSEEQKRHTPTPWHFRTSGLIVSVIGNVRFIARMESHDAERGGLSVQDAADAEFMLRAVNSHEALVDAITSRATDAAVKSGLGVSEWRAFLSEKERAALDLAEKGSN